MSQEEKNVKLFKEEKKSVKEIQEQLKVTKDEIKKALESFGYSTRTYTDLYSINHLYFNQIDSFEKAYWLGFLYADGCVHANKVCLELKDLDHVEKFKKAISTEGYSIRVREDKRFTPACITYCFQVKSEQMVEDLKKWGCVPQKSLKIDHIPDIGEDYIFHFIRGYFDGDGSISFVVSEHHYRIDFAGQENFLKQIQFYLSEGKSESKVTKVRKANAWNFGCSGRFLCEQYLDKMYKDSTDDIRLARKYESYLKLKECNKEIFK